MDDIQSLIKQSENDSALSRKLNNELMQIVSTNHQFSNGPIINRRKHLQELLDLLTFREHIISQISASPMICGRTISDARITNELQHQNLDFNRQRLSALDIEVRRRTAGLYYTNVDNNTLGSFSEDINDIKVIEPINQSNNGKNEPSRSRSCPAAKKRKTIVQKDQSQRKSGSSTAITSAVMMSSRADKNWKSNVIEPQGFPCHVCNKQFRKKGHRTRHLLTHEPEKRFGCELCPKRFAAKYTLQKHLLNSHNTDPKPFECQYCSIRFTLKKELETHLLYHIDGSKQKCFPCSACDLKFITRDDLDTHLKTHPQSALYHFNPGEKSFTVKEGLERHPLPNNKNEHVCNQCGKSFTIKYSLIRHQLSHSSRKPFRCNSCYKGFVSKTNLRTHLQNHERDDVNKPLTCHICSKRFSLKQSLKFHISFHTISDAKRYACNYCEVAFTAEKRLQQHFETHGTPQGRNTPPFQFSCQHCKKSFSSKFNLFRHMTTHSHEKNDNQSSHLNSSMGKQKASPDHMIIEPSVSSILNKPESSLSLSTFGFEDYSNFKTASLACYTYTGNESWDLKLDMRD